MMNFKNNLYRTEWLELVFAGRNKTYGAYQLRQHNALTTIRALIAGTTLILTGVVVPLLYSKFIYHENTVVLQPIDDVLHIIEYVAPEKIVEPQASRPPSQIEKVPTKRFVPLKVVPAAQVTGEMPAVRELQDQAIGQETVIADAGVQAFNLQKETVEGTGNSSAANLSDEPVAFELLESFPEFPGGQAAFSKYIGRNLRYPGLARENEISGRVIVSFIVEKNGSLSNIKILRGIGSGCDEEAIRVLKNSPSWSSGMQNGQKVRVAYTMPIFFQLAN